MKTVLTDLGGTVLLAGAGKMGGAMLVGWLDAGLPPSMAVVQEPQPAADIIDVCAKRGVQLLGDASAWGETRQGRLALAPTVIVVAVKPQVMGTVFPGLAALAGPDTLTVSIAAGRTIASFAEHLPPGAGIVRAMPNTPAAIGHGITAMVANSAATARHREIARALLAAVGGVVEVPDEAMMDAVTAVSGSGPAYVFFLVEAMAQAGVDAGLPADVAMRLARATVAGSGALLAAADDDAATLRRNVTSPGGTTAAALDVLMASDGLQPLVTRAIAAATARGRALS
ncbi:MAG: pyrroline-5-carboxylate reductase [Hyphomicrobium aestuarii]|nr:pyrroline-5-carboxylate reductase [Hyphomicrobium aestuarii]